jgi:hypothetical protein
VVAVVIQRADAKTTPTATTEKKRKAALVLDNAAASFLDRWPSPAGATAIAIASGLRQSSLSFIGLRYVCAALFNCYSKQSKGRLSGAHILLY